MGRTVKEMAVDKRGVAGKNFTCCNKVVAIVLTVLLMSVSDVLLANTEDDAAYQRLFEAMKNDPTDAEKTFQFVQAAIKKGELNSAIAALERILLNKPYLPNIQLELGVLYLRAGAPELASYYIDQALRSPEVPGWVRARATTLLYRADSASSRHVFSGSLFLAANHDSNANAAPADRLVKVLGNDALLDEDDTGRSDVSAELGFSLNHQYDFGSQAGHQLETRFNTYNRLYDKVDDIDVNALDLSVGPRFYFGPVLNPSWSLKPSVSVSKVLLDGDDYLDAYGIGLNVRKSFSTRVLMEVSVLGEDQHYVDSSTRPSASDRSGEYYTAEWGVSYLATATLMFGGELAFNQRSAKQDYESLTKNSASMYLTYAYRPGFLRASRAWRARLSTAYGDTRYDTADPLIDPDIRRHDKRLDVNLSQFFPLGRSAALVVSVAYTDNDSSLPNYDYSNVNGKLGWSYAF